MRHIKYLLLTLTLIALTACNSTKEPKKEEIKDTNTTVNITTTTSPISILGELSHKQVLVKQALDLYLNELSTFNTDAIVDMTYPKLFNVIDLDLFRQYIASMMNSTDIQILSYDTNITKLSKVSTFTNGTEFAQAEYTSIINIHFIKESLYNTEEKINFLYDALIKKYGTENIYVNLEARSIRITKEEKILILKEKDTPWQFVGDNPEYRKLYPNFLPHEVLNNLN